MKMVSRRLRALSKGRFSITRRDVAEQFYFQRRQAVADNSPLFKGQRVVVATDFDAFYDLVLAKNVSGELLYRTQVRKQYDDLLGKARQI